MNNIDKRALREAADSVIQKYGSEWFETGRQLCTVHKSKIELIAAANPATVLALLDELEVATNACIGWQGMYAEADERLRAAEKRIADLEANNDSATEALLKARRRAVTLPTGYSVRPGHPINETERGVMIPKDIGPWLSRYDVEHALRVAGICINGEG